MGSRPRWTIEKDGALSTDLEERHIMDTAQFAKFAAVLARFMKVRKRATIREIKAGIRAEAEHLVVTWKRMPDGYEAVIPSIRDFDYWLTMALDWYQFNPMAARPTIYYIPCEHGNDPGLCMEMTCIYQRQKQQDSTRAPYLQGRLNAERKTEKVGNIWI